MGRPKDEDCWKQVTRNVETGTWKCNHCGREFKGGATRIKAHLGKKKGLGIALCDRSSVPSNEEVNNSTVVMAGPSDPMEVVNGMNPGLANIDDVVGSSDGGFVKEISEIQELIGMLNREEGNIEKDLQWLESRIGQKRKRENKVYSWLEKVQELQKKVTDMRDRLLDLQWSMPLLPLEDQLQIKQLIKDAHTLTEQKPVVLPKELVLPNELMVGASFDNNLKELFDLVRDDRVLIIGVHGMGGVGKTALVTHLKNKISMDQDFKHVFWVTISQDFSIFKLQSCIAKRVGIKLDEDDEIVERAQILSLDLEKKGKLILILDDVWNYIDLQKVGITLRVNGIKLILTSRLKHVFQQIDCPRKSVIQIGGGDGPWYRRRDDDDDDDDYDDDDDDDYYYDDDGWKLLLLKLGWYGIPATLSHEEEKIARTIVKKCNGLPLGICVVARIMKRQNDIRQWRRLLNKFENLAMGEEMEVEVFRKLKLSCDHLMKNIQNCFFQCALFTGISTNELIMMLFDEGLIKETKSLEEIFDEGHAILGQLEDHSLLFDDEFSRMDDVVSSFEMNDLVRDMARYVLKGRYMVKCNKRLTKIPDMQEWAHDLEKVSLMRNRIKEIPKGISPRCHRLSTMILSFNDLREVSGCFFNYIDSLTVLDLSHNEELISLPDSLSRLRSLKSLLLKGCQSLAYVPPLGELQELSRLIISDTSIGQVPEGLAMLLKLKWLDLSGNEKLTSVPRSVLFDMTNMQYLDLWSADVAVEVENVHEMSMLEYFAGRFHVSKTFNDYVENILDRGSGPKDYYIFLGIGEMDIEQKAELFEEDMHCIHFGDCEAFNYLLPRDLYRLCISNNEQLCGGICDALSFNAPSSLTEIDVTDCPKLERLFCLCDPCSFCKHLQKLQSLHIVNCDNMEKLLTPVSLRQLPNLETIEVWSCESMKEIFAKESNEDDSIDSTVTLPRSFKKLTLLNLPQLKTVCTSIVVSESRPTVGVSDCPNLIDGSLRHKSSHSDPNTTVILWQSTFW